MPPSRRVLPATRIGAIIFAAGYSSRMGQFKPLLPFAGATVIESTVPLFLRAGIGALPAVPPIRANCAGGELHVDLLLSNEPSPVTGAKRRIEVHEAQ